MATGSGLNLGAFQEETPRARLGLLQLLLALLEHIRRLLLPAEKRANGSGDVAVGPNQWDPILGWVHHPIFGFSAEGTGMFTGAAGFGF